jgi:hypothetical protein
MCLSRQSEPMRVGVKSSNVFPDDLVSAIRPPLLSYLDLPSPPPSWTGKLQWTFSRWKIFPSCNQRSTQVSAPNHFLSPSSFLLPPFSFLPSTSRPPRPHACIRSVAARHWGYCPCSSNPSPQRPSLRLVVGCDQRNFRRRSLSSGQLAFSRAQQELDGRYTQS